MVGPASTFNYATYSMPVPAAAWDAFTNTSSPTYGKLAFVINETTFPSKIASYSGMYMRGFLGYLDNAKPGSAYCSQIKLSLKSAGTMQQQYYKVGGMPKVLPGSGVLRVGNV